VLASSAKEPEVEHYLTLLDAAESVADLERDLDNTSFGS
jgi:hypothetical protein